MARFSDYRDRFDHISLDRDERGILVLRLHTNEEELGWGPHTEREMSECLGFVADDLDNRVVIVTGTGASFIDRIDTDAAAAWLDKRPNNATAWRDMVHKGLRMMHNLLSIEVPVIGAINGPASVHSELALLSDIVICSDTAYIQDSPHFIAGLPPGDGVHIIFPALLGPNRGRYFLLTGEKIQAEEALELGMVGEVVPQHKVLDRALEHANALAQKDEHLVRHTRLILIQELRVKFQNLMSMGVAWEAYAVTASPPAYMKDE